VALLVSRLICSSSQWRRRGSCPPGLPPVSSMQPRGVKSRPRSVLQRPLRPSRSRSLLLRPPPRRLRCQSPFRPVSRFLLSKSPSRRISLPRNTSLYPRVVSWLNHSPDRVKNGPARVCSKSIGPSRTSGKAFSPRIPKTLQRIPCPRLAP
jgi:hypothetical protein